MERLTFHRMPLMEQKFHNQRQGSNVDYIMVYGGYPYLDMLITTKQVSKVVVGFALNLTLNLDLL